MKNFLAPFAVLGLAACGGIVTPASPTLPPVPTANLTTGVGAGLSGTVLSSDVAGPITSITYNGTAIAGVNKVTPTGGSYGQAQQAAADGTSFNLVAFSDDGKTFLGAPDRISASTIGTGTGSAAGFGQIASYSRAANSILPTSGTGTFQGDYRGTIGSATGSYGGHTAGAVVAIQGNATLNAVFGSGATVSGTISNRQTLLANSGAGTGLSDLTLNSTAIDGNGQFASTVSGGATGQYEGLIGGVNGTGMAGAMSMNHAGGFTEIGVFTATRTGP